MDVWDAFLPAKVAAKKKKEYDTLLAFEIGKLKAENLSLNDIFASLVLIFFARA